MQKSTRYKQRSRVRTERDEIEDEPRNGRPSTSVCEEDIDIDCLQTHSISLWVLYTQFFVENLGLSKLFARWVPRLLRPDHQQTRIDLSMEILNKWDEDSVAFLQRIVTGDET
ncbi:uncharacterized protein LOC119589792 [Penaeus monodon]|uniref:uncharacterized protein LOC119589792 n=1 Tax=Penaeus monodon TaxID=6687 RepID=UPI0018A77D99|nr:uncharacterized protein LOC119589792 [Penaeus monodon]